MFVSALVLFDLMDTEVKKNNRRRKEHSLWKAIQQAEDQQSTKIFSIFAFHTRAARFVLLLLDNVGQQQIRLPALQMVSAQCFVTLYAV